MPSIIAVAVTWARAYLLERQVKIGPQNIQTPGEDFTAPVSVKKPGGRETTKNCCEEGVVLVSQGR